MIFVPDASEIYPPGFQTTVEPGPVAEPLCGAVRPGHFRGVATVVTKLFNIVQPDVAFFGQKDFQQCAVIRQMVRDLNLPVEIVTVPTVREPDGLALSSRNSYLGPTDRSEPAASAGACWPPRRRTGRGSATASRLIEIARAHMTEVDQLQYLELRDASTLEAIQGVVEQPAALCVAAYVGPTRLIDNVLLTPPPKALSDRDLEVVSYAVGRQVTARRRRLSTVMTGASDTAALVWALNTRLIAGATATETLLAWCEEHGLSEGPITVEIRQRFAPALVPDEVVPALELGPGEDHPLPAGSADAGLTAAGGSGELVCAATPDRGHERGSDPDQCSVRACDRAAAALRVARSRANPNRTPRSSWCIAP